MFTREDIRKFYELYMRYDTTSNNIGVVDKHRFEEIYKLMKERYKDNPNVRIMLNEERTKLTVLEKEIDTTFILIRDPQDMRGRFFRKYI